MIDFLMTLFQDELVWLFGLAAGAVALYVASRRKGQKDAIQAQESANRGAIADTLKKHADADEARRKQDEQASKEKDAIDAERSRALDKPTPTRADADAVLKDLEDMRGGDR